MRILAAILLCPPWGLWRLWRTRPLSRGWKILATAGAVLYTPVFLGLVGALLLVATPLELEWKGGFPPVLTLSKTVPDYGALETHRARRAAGEPGAGRMGPGTSEYWSGFRGPRRDGHYLEGPIRTNWPADGPPLRWRQPVGGGYASFAIARGRAFTMEQRRDQEAVTAYALETGTELWAHTYPALFDEVMGGVGPRSTPTWDDGRVYALGATGEFRCLEEASGRVLWQTNVLSAHRAENLHWAQSASPLVVGDRVILCPGGGAGHSVAAYEKTRGGLLWAAGDGEAAYSSPVEVALCGRRQLLIAVKNRVLGMAPEDGQVLWTFPWSIPQNNRNIAQPVVIATNRVVLSAGYGGGAVAFELTRAGDAWSARELWRNKHLKNKFSSSVLWEGHLYGLDEDFLVCLDTATGARCWKDGRYGYGQLLLASGHLIVLGGEGELALVRAVPDEHHAVARVQALPGKTWNHPALGDGRLLVRNAVEMACYDLRLPAVAPASDRASGGR